MTQVQSVNEDDIKRVEDALKSQVQAGEHLKQEITALAISQVTAEISEPRQQISAMIEKVDQVRHSAEDILLACERTSAKTQEQLAISESRINEITGQVQQQNEKLISIRQGMTELDNRETALDTELTESMTDLAAQLVDARKEATVRQDNIEEQANHLGKEMAQMLSITEHLDARESANHLELAKIIDERKSQLTEQINELQEQLHHQTNKANKAIELMNTHIIQLFVAFVLIVLIASGIVIWLVR